MNSLANNVFTCVDDNKSYTFMVTLYTGQFLAEDGINAGLDNNDIEELEYESKINGLFVTGHITYVDKYSIVDKFIKQQLVRCAININENNYQKDGKIGIMSLDKTKKFSGDFIVSSIKITQRSGTYIKYKLELVSSNWFNCIANIKYSNYDKEKMQVFDILRDCLRLASLTVDDNTFDIVKSTVTMNYITNANDCIMSIVDYLLPKTYYFNERDNKMRFLLYNESTNKYQLLDVTNTQTITGMFTEVLSFFKTDAEGMMQPKPVNIGYVKDTIDKMDVYKGSMTYDMHDFSFDENEFSVKKISEKENMNLMNNKLVGDNLQSMYHEMFSNDLEYHTVGSYWNNNQCIYDDVAAAFQQNSTFILQTRGEILRKPGSMLTIVLDKLDQNSVTTEEKLEYEKQKQCYRHFEGQWFVAKVQNIFKPQIASYCQKLLIFRNFEQKLD